MGMVTARRRSALIAALVTLLSGCAQLGAQEPAPTTTTPIVVEKAVADAFVETITDAGLRRWANPEVAVSWFGTPTAADRRVLDETISWLSAQPGAPRLYVVADNTYSPITIHAVTTAEWPALLGNVGENGSTFDQVDAAGITTAEWSERGTMSSAVIVLDRTAAQVQRNRTIAHELMHAIGIGHHSCPAGLVFGGDDYDPSWKPNQFDSQIVQLTYDERLTPGTAGAVVNAALQRSSTNTAACPEVKWETVRSADGTLLWCENQQPVSSCQTATDNDQGGPLPTAAVVAWVKDGQLYDYDPRTHLTFSFEGKRVLCEIPTDSKRSPCQVTETGSKVEQTDWWTDGELLYETQQG